MDDGAEQPWTPTTNLSVLWHGELRDVALRDDTGKPVRERYVTWGDEHTGATIILMDETSNQPAAAANLNTTVHMRLHPDNPAMLDDAEYGHGRYGATTRADIRGISDTLGDLNTVVQPGARSDD